MRLFVLHLSDQTHYCTDFRHAMRTAAAVVFTNTSDREKAKEMSNFPQLNEINAEGSFYQFIRHTAAQKNLKLFLIEEHHLGGPPLSSTLVNVIDAIDDLDPSFIIQKALWEFVNAERQLNVGHMADEIEHEIAIKLQISRTSCKPDEDILNNLLSLEERMRGIKVIPKFGLPKTILDQLPNGVSQAFLSIIHAIPKP